MATYKGRTLDVYRAVYHSSFYKFDAVIFIQGTEEQVTSYLREEIGEPDSCFKLSEKEIEAVNNMGLTIYWASDEPFGSK